MMSYSVVALISVLSLLVAVQSYRLPSQIGRRVSLAPGLSKTALFGVGKEAKRAWAKEDLQGDDIFADDDGEDDLESMKKKQKFKLEPETVFYEGPPSASGIVACYICVDGDWYYSFHFVFDETGLGTL